MTGNNQNCPEPRDALIIGHKAEHRLGVCLLRYPSASWSALGLLTLVNLNDSTSVMDEKLWMEIVISGYKLHQEAQLLNEHYGLNTEIDRIHLPSIGVHTPLAQQEYPSLGCSSNINKRYSSLSKPHEEGPHNNSRTVSQDLQNSGDHGPAPRIWRTAFGFLISLLSALSDPGHSGPSFCFRLMPSVVSGSPKFLDSELSDIFCKVFQVHCFFHGAMCSWRHSSFQAMVSAKLGGKQPPRH